jgi:hypothetical protein
MLSTLLDEESNYDEDVLQDRPSTEEQPPVRQ